MDFRHGRAYRVNSAGRIFPVGIIVLICITNTFNFKINGDFFVFLRFFFIQCEAFSEAFAAHSGSNSTGGATVDVGSGIEGAFGVGAVKDAGTVEAVDSFAVDMVFGHVGNGAFFHSVNGGKSLIGKGTGEDGRELGAGSMLGDIIKIAEDVVILGVSKVDLLRGAAVELFYIVGAAIIDAVKAAGDDDGGEAGNVIAHTEGGAVTLHDVIFVACLGVFGEGVAGGDISILALGIGVNLCKVMKSRANDTSGDNVFAFFRSKNSRSGYSKRASQNKYKG